MHVATTYISRRTFRDSAPTTRHCGSSRPSITRSAQISWPEPWSSRVYDWLPLPAFVARVLDKPRLFLMDDPLAKVNVLAYRPGEALNWHFDRSQFTTTLLIRAAEAGGEFEYRSGLRSDTDPNYDGVATMLRGEDPDVSRMSLAAGTLNVFAGKNTAHRVTPVQGTRNRVVAVFSYYDNPGVAFSSAERMGFYGRAA